MISFFEMREQFMLWQATRTLLRMTLRTLLTVLTLFAMLVPGAVNAENVQGVSKQGQNVPDMPVVIGAESADFDGAALPGTVVGEGKAVRLKASLSGIQYMMLVNEDGSAVGTVNTGGGLVDDAVFTIGVSNVGATGFLVDDTASDSADEGDIGIARMSPTRVLRVTPGNDAGTAATYGAGAVAATTPRTTLASDDPAVVALQIIDDWDETNRAAVNTIAGQVGVQGGAGVSTALTQRVALATDANTIQISQTTPATTNGVTPVPTTNAAAANALTSSGAAQASNVLKASAGNLYSLTITTGATAGYLMVFNATSAPIDGAVTPAYCSQAPANMTSALEWSIPVRLATGITVVFSTTGCFTKTESATAAFFAQVN